ncbi:MAG: SAM-dependent methyltransferase [Bacteroidetes bacterium]|nr:SAM-dependent methyltransferase [Bacteroidota bacterium]
MAAAVYLIPSLLAQEGLDGIPPYIKTAIKECSVFFTENERTTRRYFKQLWKVYLPGQEMVIDDYEWYTISESIYPVFREKIREGKTIGIISEAGCPGVADPGQSLVAIAQEMGVAVKPLVGPSSILLALMASGMNGQQFHFVGYLPIDEQQRAKVIKNLEIESAAKNCTQIFIETPYRNNQLLQSLMRHCRPATRLCIAANITGKNEFILTKKISAWKSRVPDLHKQPAVFCMNANAGSLT